MALCFVAAAPLSARPSHSFIAPRHPPRRRVNHPRLRKAQFPTCHTHHSHCGHSHAPSPPITSATTPSPALVRFFQKLRTIHERPPIAFLSAVLLSLAALLYLLHLPPPPIHFLLYTAASVTTFPSLLSSLTTLFQTRLTITVDLLMSLSAFILILSNSLFEGVLLSTLYALSHAAETLVQNRATKALNNLRDLSPTIALRLPTPTSTPIPTPIDNIKIGHYLLIKVAELVPCDSRIVSGSALVSTQILTGESTPKSFQPSDFIPAGAKVEDAPLVVQVVKTGAESSMARIARLVTAAQENRPQVSLLFDTFGAVYARAVLLVSAMLALLLPLITAMLPIPTIAFAGRQGSIARALGVLVTASPCALMIGAPVAYVAALSAAARRGVLAKGGARVLEAACRIKRVVFDKTGTLTTGRLALISAQRLPNSSGNGVVYDAAKLDDLPKMWGRELERVVGAAAALGRGAVHPVADAVQRFAERMKVPEAEYVKVVAGQGVEGVLEGVEGKLGRPSFVFAGAKHVAEQASERGETTAVLALGAERFLLRLRDEVREEAQEAVTKLKRVAKVDVLTGDASGAAQFVSRAVGGLKVVSNATPEDKLNYIRSEEGVLMVGDGVNDAAALAAACVGVACGLSSATAVHAADVVLVREDLMLLPWLLRLARRTRRIVVQNLVTGLVLMIVGATLCACAGVPLWLAVTMHEGGTILVGLNALRLLRE